MPVHIKQINIESAGPIRERQFEMGRFNLIYGRNEQGKTFLVEFLIRSLFKNHAGWDMRQAESRGRITITGLGNRAVLLMPGSRHKLEDRLAEDEPGLPSKIGRLLVVKGAELSFEGSGGSGVSKVVLKEFLSGQGLLDEVQSRISRTVQNAQIEDGQPMGKSQGEIKRLNDLVSERRKMDELFQQIDSIYSAGERQELQERAAELEAQLREQELAKRHQAFMLAGENGALEKQIEQTPEDSVGQLQADHASYQSAERRISTLKERLAALAPEHEHREWLEQAASVYQQRSVKTGPAAGPLIPILILLALLLAAVASFFNIPLMTLGLILVAAVLGWSYWRHLSAAAENALDNDEINKLESEYQRRFGRPLSGLPLLKKTLQGSVEAYHGARAHRENLNEERANLDRLHDQIVAQLHWLTGDAGKPGSWDHAILQLLSDRKALEEKLNEGRLALATLGVAMAEQSAQPASHSYEPEQLREMNLTLDGIKKSLGQQTAELAALKQRICQETGQEISAGWSPLIELLQEKRQAITTDYRKLTAEIMAGILVNGCLDEIRTEEEEKIESKLGDDLVSEPLYRMTGRYTSVIYEEGVLSARDAFGQFPIDDLSTGAREQLLLALRLGFAAQLLGQNQLFLILDDAFQHADWGRRVRLVNQMVLLAQTGWQIIYFTMDQHIKELFEQAGRHHFADQYRYHQLAES